MSIHDLLDKMESAEEAFLQTEFLAPVLPGGWVRVRIAGLVCTLRVAGSPQPGWAILRPLSMDRARVVGQPGLRQVRDYLALFPAVRMLLLGRAGQPWLAIPAHQSDSRFQFDGPVRVYLVTGAQLFQRVIARFDGSQFWFEEVDRRRSPAIAAYLREALDAGTRPEELHRPTLTAEEREAYRLAQAAAEALLRQDEEPPQVGAERPAVSGRAEQVAQAQARVTARQPGGVRRLTDALAHAGAELISYIERPDAYTVTYSVDDQQHVSTVHKDDLTVLSAGICLSGRDEDFDLQSLVSVLRPRTRR
jgi:hypothetical protein